MPKKQTKKKKTEHAANVLEDYISHFNGAMPICAAEFFGEDLTRRANLVIYGNEHGEDYEDEDEEYDQDG